MSICKAPAKDGSPCQEDAGTSNWCLYHSKKLRRKYIAYKNLEKKLQHYPENTIDALRHKLLLVGKIIFLRSYLHENGFAEEFRDEGHKNRIDNLQKIEADIFKKLERQKDKEKQKEKVKEKRQKVQETETVKVIRPKKVTKPPVPLKPLVECLDYTTADTYYKSLYAEMRKRNSLVEDVDTQDSMFCFAVECVIEEVIEELDESILMFLESKFKNKAEHLYEMCLMYLMVFDFIVCCHGKNINHTQRKNKNFTLIRIDRNYDHEYIPENGSYCFDFKKFRDTPPDFTDHKLYFRMCVASYLNSYLDANLTSKYITLDWDTSVKKNRYYLNFDYCLHLTLKNIDKIHLIVTDNTLTEALVSENTRITKTIKLQHICVHVNQGIAVVDSRLIRKVLAKIKQPCTDNYIEIMLDRFIRYRVTGLAFATGVESETCKEFLKHHKKT